MSDLDPMWHVSCRRSLTSTDREGAVRDEFWHTETEHSYSIADAIHLEKPYPKLTCCQPHPNNIIQSIMQL